jgi:3',5'-cyclic AMP phosphodiesterase CpdA
VPSDSVDGPYQYHSVTFEGLGADSTYAYRVGDGTHWSEWFHAETATAEPAPFSFLYLGDAQNNLRSHWSRAIRAAYAEAPDAAFAVHSGDLVNLPHRNVEWGRWHQAGDWIQSMVPTVPVPGNHEYGSYGESWELFTGSTGVEGPEASSGLSVHWRPQFALPKNGPKGLKETVYFLDHQGLRLIGLNTMAAKKDSTMLRRQTEWLETVLQNAESRWIVVTLHHPLFASAVDRENPDLRKAWRPLLAKYGVDLVLQGHDHTYARGRSENLTQGVNARPSGGPVYVNSVSGAKMYPLKDDRWAEYEGIDLERGGENTQLYQVVRVGRDTMRYRSYTVTGDRYDAFDLVRRDGGAPNEMIQRMPGDAGERTHENTIPYERP